MSSSRKTVIIGSGVFGLSTAYHLLQRGWSDITVIDRSETLPAPDGASNDINRIVRTSYSDPFYCELAKDAIAAWKDTELWSDTYHESGVLVVGSAAPERDYVRKAHANDIAHGLRVTSTDTPDALRAVFPEDADVGDLAGHYTYFGLDGGWANAGQGVSLLIGKVRAMGGRVLGGKDVVGLVREGGKTVGVRCRDGSVLDGSLVVLATGSWTCSAFPDTAVSKLFQATGQVVAMVQLTPEEAEVYRKCPVVLDFDSGFYVFPPNEQNILKMAIHAAGFTHSIGDDGISTPRTITSDPETGLRIPKASVKRLRDGLRAVYPTLATKPFCATRLCWYNDSVDEDWVIGYQPGSEQTVMIATAGSGHAYKFLPVIGRLVADAIENKQSPEVAAKFAPDRVIPSKLNGSRDDQVQELDLSQLCLPEDLQ